MENRSNRNGLGGRGRRPLADLSSQLNIREVPQNGAFAIKQSFTIYQDNEPPNTSSRLINDENLPPGGLIKRAKFPVPPPPAPAPPVPLATSSPAPPPPPPRQKQSSSSSSSSIESNEPAIDAYALISKSSASNFRRNNDSISSATTNDDDASFDEDIEDDNCDDPEATENYVIKDDEVPNLEERTLQALNDEYAIDILKGMIEREENYLPKWNYMTKQPDITFTMRSILIDWLIEVGEEYKLNTETLFLAVNYIDRFLSLMSVQRAKLQLVGTACMFIAAKYEEIYPPDVTEFCYITDGTYTKRQVLRMEQLVLGALSFECAPPTAFFFVNHVGNLAGCGSKTQALAQYLTELTMIDGEAFMPFAPSTIACAAVALARHTLGLAAWEDAMVTKTGYNVDDFKECLIRMHETFETAPDMQQQAVREKYKNASYHSVSEVKPTPIF